MKKQKKEIQRNEEILIVLFILVQGLISQQEKT